MKHQVNSSWVSYGYDGMGRKLYAEYSESLLKSAMPQSSVMDRLQAIYGGSVASSSASSSTSSSSSASGSSGSVSSGHGAASSAGRTFKNAQNIEVANPQPLIIWDGLKTHKGDFHKSHNRVNDWINKIKKEERK